jgi:hypothetical protein
MSAEDMRKSLTLLEGTAKTTTTLEEAAPMGFFKKLMTAAAAMVSDVKLGELETGAVANKLYAEYNKYLGLIGKKPATDDVGDLFDFLVRQGHSQQAIITAMGAGLAAPIKTKDDLEAYWNTNIKTDYKNKITKTFLNLIQAEKKLPPAELDPAKFAQRAAAGAATAAGLEKSAPPAAPVGKFAAAAVKPAAVQKPAPAPEVPETAPSKLQDMIKTDPAKAAQILDKLLKKLGA